MSGAPPPPDDGAPPGEVETAADAAARLAALIASRICHDVVGPLGAVGNGVELLAMTGADGPEVQLIADSVEAASARLRLHRIAYGLAAQGQRVARRELAGLCAALSRTGRVAVAWEAEGDPPRAEARAVLLLVQCLEWAMPGGGRIAIRRAGEAWELVAEGPRLKTGPEGWGRLDGAAGSDPEPGTVQFALAPLRLAELGRGLARDVTPERIVLRF